MPSLFRRRRCSPTRPPALDSSANLGSDALAVRNSVAAKFVCWGLLKLVVLRSRLQERAL
jgi:hypothetical protein